MEESSERKSAVCSAYELREKSELLDAILDGLVEGVLATDLKGRVLFANPAIREMLGMSEERIESLDEAQELPEEPFEDFDLRRAVARCAKEGECPEAVARRGGSSLWIRLRRLEKFDEHRGGVLVMVRDLSERRHVEANQQRFLSVAAHELKTPLTAIAGIAELLLLEEEDPAVRRRFLEHLGAESRRARDLSETLLGLARTGHDQRDPRSEAVELLEAAKQATARMEPLARGAGLELQVEGEGGRVWADREWLEQVLLAVLDNAMKYSDPGGIVRLRAGANSLSVEDEGCGISEADLPRVFEPLYQGGRQGGRREPQSAGLGLPISQDLVERMGGRISAESKEGVGTTIKIELPETGHR